MMPEAPSPESAQAFHVAAEPVIVSDRDGARTVVLNRPQARNALTWPMLEALETVLANAARDDAVRCVVLTGAGNGFCAGGDVKAMAQGAILDDEGRNAAILIQQRIQRGTSGMLHSMPKPTIAMINGAAAGAGLALALACDIRLMASTAILTTAFAKIGLSGDFGGTYFLSRLVGTARARELYFLSARIEAGEAFSLGLANKVVAPDALAGETEDWARRLASGPGTAFRYMKENLNRALVEDMTSCLDREAENHILCSATADHREAAIAFVEGRQPLFTGR